MKKVKKGKSKFSVSMDVEIKKLQVLFSGVPDSRASNSCHRLEDVLMGGYAMFSLKHPSLLSFEKQNQVERNNLQKVYGIENICSDAQTRKILDDISPNFIRQYFTDKFQDLEKVGILKDYGYEIGGNKYLIVSTDGVHHFSSRKVCCDKCLKWEHRDGSISYHHQMLCSALVHPDKREVFIVDAEPILNTDGFTKNDCELNAGKRLISHINQGLGEYLQTYNFLMVEDALYANGPHIERLLNANFDYIINVKPDSHKVLFSQIEGRKKREDLRTHQYRKAGILHEFEYANNVRLNNTSDIRCNFLRYRKTNKKGKKTTFTWITNIKITKSRLPNLMKTARARWKIENETFNTLKNLGYHFGHNFGHGKEHLSTMFAYLMLLAFHIDQFIQSQCHTFIAIEQEIYAKIKLWESIKSIFHTTKCQSMDQIYRFVADLYGVKIE